MRHSEARESHEPQSVFDASAESNLPQKDCIDPIRILAVDDESAVSNIAVAIGGGL
jgi:hypothetical protein